MKRLLTQKNISMSLAVLMAGLIISSATANPKAKRAFALNIPEVNEYVDDYMETLETSTEAPSTIKLYGDADELLFDGELDEMTSELQKQYRQAEYLSQMGGTKYFKIFH